MSARNGTTAVKPFFGRVLQGLLSGSGRTLRKERVREYIGHRLGHGARLREVLQEDYVQRNCSKVEIDEIIRDPRLIRADRVSLEKLFESGELDPYSVRGVHRRR